METLISAFILVALLSSSYQYQPSTARSVFANDLIDQVCQKTRNPSLCESTLESDPKSAGSDTKGLAHIVCDKSLDNANETLYKVVPELVGKAREKAVVDKLQSCRLIYAVIVTDVSSAVAQLDSGKNDVALSYLEIAANGTDSCEKVFTLVPPKMKSPLSDRDNPLMSLIHIAQDIIHLLV
ncbi:pectinesterase inhibitor-like [Neltuma alba]|uniref:pectinesterase inhibitor-like n=1 Tax=Neltuma alba TaxID=207710 RepID=UPI0010A41E96|nr:pectinesterase inhibitor-like [Prosopis alba]